MIETIAELRIPEVENANAWGKCHSSAPEPVGPLNIRINEPPAEFAPDFPYSKRKGVPCPSGVFGCHLCCAICAAGAFISTITRESKDA